MKRFVALMMCAVSLFSAAQCYETPCDLPSNSIALTPDGQVWYNSDLPIAGIQFEIEGANMVSASDGEMGAAGYLVLVDDVNNILGAFSLNLLEAVIEPGCGVLTNLSFEGNEQPSTITNPIAFVVDGTEFGLEVVEWCNISGIPGCTDSTACNYDETAEYHDGTCIFPEEGRDCNGCTETPCDLPSNSIALTPDGQVWYNSDLPIAGIQFEIEGANMVSASDGEMGAAGYLVLVDDVNNILGAFSLNLLEAVIEPGCGVLTNLSFEGNEQPSTITNPIAFVVDGTEFGLEVVELCNISGIPGCTDSTACNFDETAVYDDGSCIAPDCEGVCGGSAVIDQCGVCGGGGIPEGACDCDGNVLDECGECGGGNSSCSGCTHDNATNFDATATIDDGTCLYSQEAYDLGVASVECPEEDESGCATDFNGDGEVATDDLLVFLSTFGDSCE